MVFFGKPRSRAAEGAVENPPIITLPLVALAILSAVGGVLNLPGVHTLEHWLEHTLHGLEPGEFILCCTVWSRVSSSCGWRWVR